MQTNGMGLISMLWDLGRKSPELEVFSDASGSWGCGAVCGSSWFQLQWDSRLQALSIAIKEMIPVVLASAVFGRGWSGKIIQFHVDNKAVVDIINSTSTKNTHLMHLTRVLVFMAAHFNFWFKAKHIEGQKNSLADALSRNKMSLFFSQAPQAAPSGTEIPLDLMLLVSQTITWTSTTWTELFSNITRQL